MNKKIKIKLPDFVSIKKYAQKVTRFMSPIDVIKGSVCYDGKSIMAILALGTLEDIWVVIHSEDDEEINRFYEAMKEFAA